MQVTTVTLVRADQVALQASSAPAIPQLDVVDPQAPDTSFQAPDIPDVETAPTEAVVDDTEAPDAADANPDLSALTDLSRPEVVNVDPIIVQAPQFDQNAPAVFQPAQDGNELNAPTAMIAPPPPRNAPRIDMTAAARPPEDATPAPQDQAAATQDGNLENVDESQDATAQPESTTEITPDGQDNVEISAYAPQSAVRPPIRPRGIGDAQLAAQQAARERQAELDRQKEDDAILDALLAEQAEQAAAAAAQQPVVTELTGIEKAAIGDVVSGFWNKGLITGQPEYEQYVVRVAVNVDRFGAIEGEVRPVEPADPTGVFRIAFDAARRAILQAGTIPLPSGVYPDGVELILRFDPASGEVGLR